ncbi:MAG: superfamily protein [Flavipsychrobacter sp.]|nr:superfamily protein [Flavipsychrobacter sp.]
MLKDLHDLLLRWDHTIWYYVNTQWHNSFLDCVVPFLRNQWFWVPLYLFLALFMPARFRKNGLIWCLLFIVSFIFSDQISAHLLKPIFHRLRPCNDPMLSNIIHVIVPCGSGYSFPSSHAANHFALGVFSAITLGKVFRWVWPVAILWAVLVSFSQVYVGVHFPLDVTSGALIGTIIAICTGSFFNYYFRLSNEPFKRIVTDNEGKPL